MAFAIFEVIRVWGGMMYGATGLNKTAESLINDPAF